MGSDPYTNKISAACKRLKEKVTMTTADLIRSYVVEHYVAPARVAGCRKVRVRLGDVRQGMKLSNPLQSVRSALGAKLFQCEAGVELLAPLHPTTGADTCFEFRIHPVPSK